MMNIEAKLEILEEKKAVAAIMGKKDIADFYQEEINHLEQRKRMDMFVRDQQRKQQIIARK